MKQTLETLKSYFETGDKPTQAEYEDLLDSLVHKDDVVSGTSESTSFINTIFIDTQNGDDTTAKISNINKPFQSIDAAITAFETENPRITALASYEHSFLTVALISSGTYPINGLLPQRNIHFSSSEICTIDLTNNVNEIITGEEAGSYYKYKFSLKNGKLLNDSENKIAGTNLVFEADIDVIESHRLDFSGFTSSFITVRSVKINCNLFKGKGNIFQTTDNSKVNYLKGNIESIDGHLMLCNQALGTFYFDFDVAKGTHKVSLLSTSTPVTSYVKFGKHYPAVVSEIFKISGNSKLFVNFKEGAETYGSFLAGEMYLMGNSVHANASLARVQSKLIFDNLSVKCSTTTFSLSLATGQVIIKNSTLEIPSNLGLIETNINFINDMLTFVGHNSIIQTSSPGADLVTKVATSSPTNVNYKVELQNSLITNGVLNTTITGNSDSTATLTIGTTNTY